MDPLLIVAIVGIVVPVGVTVYQVLARRAHDSERREVERRLAANESSAVENRVTTIKLTDKLHENDLVTERMVGKLALESQKHEATGRDLNEIKAKMVTRDMFMSLSDRLDQILKTRGFGSSSMYQRVNTPSTDPPKGR